MTNHSKNKKLLLNIGFAVIGIAIVAFLLNAPDETTSFLPKDEIHIAFHAIESKKEAEKSCIDCHSETGVAPLPEKHPPKYRCLFCHKR
ncbi:hypothetical protein [Desulfosediminicola flagellatus]|uniref:hypothetical protein n=1 Tax=Desulfosediminicola flagellatus TaxID=2569541 RepID=UPI0010AD2AA1|nr:hypothetical protein [Desulfosediminicola flagellatus]